MKKNLVEILLIICLILIAFSGTVSADYSFEIPKAQTTLEVESDGTMTVFIEYEIKNLGQKLDFIDIGLPNNNYTLSDVKVTLNGSENSEIKVTRADYEQTGLRYGISLEMRNASLASGESAVVDVWIPNLRKNLFDATSETIDGEAVEFAGFEFSPNYFSPKFTKGKTDYSFIIVFPPGAGWLFISCLKIGSVRTNRKPGWMKMTVWSMNGIPKMLICILNIPLVVNLPKAA